MTCLEQRARSCITGVIRAWARGECLLSQNKRGDTISFQRWSIGTSRAIAVVAPAAHTLPTMRGHYILPGLGTRIPGPAGTQGIPSLLATADTSLFSPACVPSLSFTIPAVIKACLEYGRPCLCAAGGLSACYIPLNKEHCHE